MTHRCHDREFLLKFVRDRNAYRAKLLEHLDQYDLSILDYCLTSNHVHLLIEAAQRDQLSGFMRQVEGEFARAYNQRKGRSNAFWGDPYHATLIEPGDYLWRCLIYIELNMVRCGVVKHPREWEWVGYHEIMGTRQRYRLIDLERLCWRLGTDRVEEVRKNLEVGLVETIARDWVKREPCWTESLAVGSASFLEKFKPEDFSRRETEILEAADSIWALREAPPPYGLKTGPKSAANGLRRGDFGSIGL